MALGVYRAGRRSGQCGGAVAFAGGTKELGPPDDGALGSFFDELFPTAPMAGSRFPSRKSGPPEREKGVWTVCRCPNGLMRVVGQNSPIGTHANSFFEDFLSEDWLFPEE